MGRQILSQIFHELSMPVEVAQVEQSVEKGPEDMSPITQSTSVTPCLGEKSVTGVSEERHKELAHHWVAYLGAMDKYYGPLSIRLIHTSGDLASFLWGKFPQTATFQTRRHGKGNDAKSADVCMRGSF